jgi:putative hydrolase of the HAD superfamily
LAGRHNAILFDAGGTLLRVQRSVGEIYAQRAARHGVSVSPEALEAAFRKIWDDRRDSLLTSTSDEIERRWWYEVVEDVFAATRQRAAFGDSFEGFFDELYDLFSTPTVWRVFEDVSPTLDMLENHGIRTAVVSNWDCRLPRLLERLGLAERFEFILTSAQAGFRKPDPRIFEAALNRLGLLASRVVHVGDSYEDDIIGAKSAGVTAVLIERQGNQETDCPAIRSLKDLLPWLEAAAG